MRRPNFTVRILHVDNQLFIQSYLGEKRYEQQHE